MRRALAALRGWLCALLAAVSSAAAAQTLDEADVRMQSDAVIVRLRFNAAVGFVDQQPTTSADRYRVRFEFLAADDALLRQTVDEERHVAAQGALPEATISYRPDGNDRTRQLVLVFARPVVLQARQGANSRSLEFVVRAATAAAEAAVPPAAPPPAAAAAAASGPASVQETERLAAELIARYREERLLRHTEAMIAALEELLRLPPNRQTRAAQEAIGAAWEEAGEPARARVEYELYLKLYPQGEGATRVAQRLQALGGAPAAALPAAAAPAPARETAPAFAGSIAQYYNGGKAKTKSLVNIATGIDQATLSKTTESAIVTSVDLSGRYKGDGSETRAVVRGSGTTSLIAGSHGSSAISAAYLDYRRTPDGLEARAGRQSPVSGGLLGLFDGVSLAWPARPGLKIDLMGGTPASPLVSAPGERLAAAVIEADGLLDRWGGNAYLLQQNTEGIVNRRALGSEVRYAGERWSLNTLVDYDTLFGALNALSAHASVQADNQTTVTLLVDERRAPSLQLTNALISSGADSLKTLLATETLEQIKADARATSAIARQALVSFARPVDERWQMAMDLRFSEIGALPAVGDFEATPATGAQYTATLQFTGTNLYSARDVNNVSFSVTSTPSFKGFQLAYNNLSGLGPDNRYTVEPSLRIYAQRDQQDVQLVRVGPGLRFTHKATRRASLLGELLYEASRTTGPTNHDSSQSVFFYVGYRYELF